MQRSVVEKGVRTSRTVDVRLDRLRSSVSTRNFDVKDLLKIAMRDRSPRVRATAVELIAEERDSSFSDSLLKMLGDSSRIVRGEAVEALGNIGEGSGDHNEEIVLCLRDIEPLVRIAALESLTQIRDIEAIPEMRFSLEDDDPLVRAYGAIALAELGGHTCLASLSAALISEKVDKAAAGILVAIRILDERGKFSALLNFLFSANYQVRCFVANWLPRLNLDSKELEAARESIKRALAQPLGRADASTMSRVLLMLDSPTNKEKGR